ncbi:MAG: glycosyltransferase family 39 protein [Anaerolineae bacterium]
MLIFIGFALRLAPLGRYVTPDEPNWVYRSIQFSDALAAADWSAIPPTGHPGVTTMWLGTVGIHVRGKLGPEESARHLAWIRRLAWLDPASGEAFRHLATFLPWGRIAVALVTSLGLVVLYRLVSQSFQRRVALLTVGLLALDPFLIGHSGLLHTDALLATFTLLALVAALSALQRPRQTAWWALAGLFTGLALLTKSPALILLAFIPLLVVCRHLLSLAGNSREMASFPRVILHCSLFAACSAVTFFALHPGMWGDPVARLLSAFSLAERHVTSVQRPMFFAGRMVLDPGPAFYPLVFLFRVSPLALTGLIVGLVFLRRLSPERRSAFAALILFAVLFGVGMSLGTKKHPRYLLPILPPLALAAALGVDGALTWHTGSAPQAKQQNPRLVSLSIVLLQAVIALVHAAYPLTYQNPLLGGPLIASKVLPTGWGEGLGAAALHLNRLPDADRLTVAASSVPSFAPLFEGRTLLLDSSTVPLSDYVVSDRLDERLPGLVDFYSFDLPSSQQPTTVYTNTASSYQASYLGTQVGSGDLVLLDADTPLERCYKGPGELLSLAALPNEDELAEWMAHQVPGHEAIWLVASSGASPIAAEQVRRQLEVRATPVSTATVASATIIRFIPRPAAAVGRSNARYDAAFGGQLALVDAAIAQTVAWPDPLAVTLRWRALTSPSGDYLAVLHLRDSAGHSWATRESPVRNEVNFSTSAWSAGEWSDARYELRLLPGTPPDHYTLEVSVYDLTSGAKLGAVAPDGDFRGTQVPVGEVAIAPPAEPTKTAELRIARPLNVRTAALSLIGMSQVPERVLSGDHLSLELFWEAEGDPRIDYRVRLRLLGSAGEVALEVVHRLSPYPTSEWRARDRFRGHYSLYVSPRIVPGRHRLALNLLDESGNALWQSDWYPTRVEVLPRERSFTLPEIPRRLDVTFGGRIHLLGYAPLPAEVAPGERIPLTLYLQTDGPTDRSYTLFVHLLNWAGELRGQVDLIPGDGTAPTTSWAEGQVIVQKAALPVAADAEIGVYRVVVGFYDAAYGRRLPVAGATDHVLSQGRAVLPPGITVAP